MQLVLYANPRDKARIQAAFSASATSLLAVAALGAIVQWPITVVYTFNTNVVAGSPILVLPGNKIQSAEDLPPTTFVVPKDPLTLNEVQAVWSIYGAIVADTDQTQQLALQ
jgi:ABC-type nitrate/sulfonate/bicarbonate transport system substrate-binding protein